MQRLTTRIIGLRRLHPLFVLTISAFVVVALDQLLKVTVLNRVADETGGFLVLRCVMNPNGGRWFSGRRSLLAVWVLEAGLLLTLARAAFSLAGPVPQAGLGMVLGGITSNLLDRLRRGGVIDVVDLGVWPVFNLADVAIVAGVLLTAAGALAAR
jgi:signal peptidase II